ncbi:hypothetical protein N7492_006936 [Penicillium capsulatum]|uniref:BHLH domain-containing protein n=1 Tax=Penicillium capsulatum TaxID=69766 RepID=A0A9W9I0B5_9EURO|nr:hypothetical protein N7492_006936 [Penicillium capsulatum]
MSGEFTIKDQPADPSDMFALPAAALSPAVDSSRRSSRSDPTYVPVSPESPRARGAGGRSGATKRSLEEFELPPPPTRTRKIIQMKPKSPASKASTKPKEKEQAGPQTSPESPPATSGKRKQPSATSAAGRKIARKTAHSLIERRRRSKMNEEFGTLKDMIPACRGQEMHKLAILSASIDYVNYLEQCISDLKTAGSHSTRPPSPPSPEFHAEDGMDSRPQSHHRPSSSAYSYSESVSVPASPEPMASSTQMSDTSPSFSPRTRGPSLHTVPDTVSILPSPALGPTFPSAGNAQDLQGIDHEASAALLMLTQDRRGTADSISEQFPGSTRLAGPQEKSVSANGGRRKGMSVRDLLIS